MKFYGPIGFGESQETKPGVFEDVITERNYRGSVERSSRQAHAADKVNEDISVNNVISVISDQYANEHLFAIRYISWMGTLWTISDVELQSPRLLIRLGGVYNGPKGAVANTP